MHKFYVLFLSVFLISVCEAEQQRVAITQFVSHAALNAVRENAVAVIKQCAAKDIKISVRDANASLFAANQIAKQYLSEKPDVIIAISTPSAQAVLNATRGKIPIVFAAVTDPSAAKLMNDDGSHKALTGVTDLPSFEDQLRFILKILPNLKTIGIIYSAGEANSRASILMIKEAAELLKLKIIEAPVSKFSEISQAASHLIDKVDALYVPNDNLIASSIESVIKVAYQRKIPVFAADILLVSRGALAMRGFDYDDIGHQVGEIACEILKGKEASAIPIENPQRTKTYLNLDSAKILGIELDQGLIRSAEKVFSSQTAP
jgi:putative ABC transport system substrate-binding protein